eukprot:365302-Chlamydomonas_euryale.AAC.1
MEGGADGWMEGRMQQVREGGLDVWRDGRMDGGRAQDGTAGKRRSARLAAAARAPLQGAGRGGGAVGGMAVLVFCVRDGSSGQ